ncbi:MAG: FAD-binding oxidoreductase [Pseudonocardia sp.]|nr:FAD-binding oxidoreductase [Pseudonocardia sp.]
MTSLDASTPVTALAALVRGAVFGPDDPAAAVETAAYNLMTVHRPDVALLAADAADVAAAVSFAGRTGRTVAVQATGHSAAAAGPGSVLVLTRLLDEVTVDPVARTARVGAGVRWQQVLDAAAPYGLAALCGSAPGVGVVGYTLGGGLGPLGREYGYAADRVREIEVVTAGGEPVRATADREPELFRALRGGGAAFGIVTAMTIELVPVPTVFGGGIFYSTDIARTVLRRWQQWAPTLPEHAGTSIARLNLPDDPMLPPPLRGCPVVHLRFTATGPAEDAARLLAPMRAAGPALLDTVAEIPFAAIGSVHMDPPQPLPALERGALLAELPEAAVEAFAEITAPSAGLPFTVAELRRLGGALAREADVPNTVSGRAAAYSLFVVGVAVPPVAEAVPGALDAVLARMAPWSSGGSLLNFAGRGQRDAAFAPGDLERLRRLRAAVDPSGILAASARWS